MTLSHTFRILLVLLLTTGFAASAGAAPVGASDDDPTIERLRAETERARAEAERAHAQAELARAEAERLRVGASDLAVAVAEAVPDPGAYRRDGFFLRMAAGGGYSGFHSSGPLAGVDGVDRDLTDHSPGGSFLFSIGGIVATDTALHADFWFEGGMPTHEGAEEFEVSNGTTGFGVTHYWMPWNVYISGAVGLSITTWTTPDDDALADDDAIAAGLGTYVMVGKEWWVSENWSLGVALRGSYAWTANDDVTFHHTNAQALFSATFN